jgi:hypothetical protein
VVDQCGRPARPHAVTRCAARARARRAEMGSPRPRVVPRPPTLGA